MMNHPQRDSKPSDNLLQLLAGVSFIVLVTTLVIIGPDGMEFFWNLIF